MFPLVRCHKRLLNKAETHGAAGRMSRRLGQRSYERKVRDVSEGCHWLRFEHFVVRVERTRPEAFVVALRAHSSRPKMYTSQLFLLNVRLHVL